MSAVRTLMSRLTKAVKKAFPNRTNVIAMVIAVVFWAILIAFLLSFDHAVRNAP